MIKIHSVQEREGSFLKLRSLLENDNRKIHGVSYNNSFFSRRYLCRSSVGVKEISIEDNMIKLMIPTRVEAAGIQDIEQTLNFLARYEAGDIPGFSPEGMYDRDEPAYTEPAVPEPISPVAFLISVDILLKMKNPTVTYKDFTIAGEKFTLVELHETFDAEPDEDDEEAGQYEQTVLLLFGSKEKFSLMSHFYDKNLSYRDMKLIMDLFVDENLTGKAIKSIVCQLPNGISLYQFPFDSLITSYTTSMNDYIFGSGYGYIRLTDSQLRKFKMECVPNLNGSYSIRLLSKELDIFFILE